MACFHMSSVARITVCVVPFGRPPLRRLHESVGADGAATSACAGTGADDAAGGDDAAVASAGGGGGDDVAGGDVEVGAIDGAGACRATVTAGAVEEQLVANKGHQ